VTASIVESTTFRRTLGHFFTGATVVFAMDGGRPIGSACQSFAALSLDPPLVLFCPGRTSRTWPLIERAGAFCVNVLSHRQRDVSTVFGTAGADKFADIAWNSAPSGAPVLNGALAWIDCAVEAVHEAGDHYVVIGRVTTLGATQDERPLLFYRGAYSVTEQAEPTPGILDNLITWSRDDDWI